MEARGDGKVGRGLAIWSTTPARMRRLRRWHGRWSATQVGTCRTACAENHLLLSQEAHPRVSTRARTRRRWTGLCNPHESIDGPGVCRVTMGWSRPRCRNLAAPGGSRGPSRCHRWRFDPSERPLSRRFSSRRRTRPARCRPPRSRTSSGSPVSRFIGSPVTWFWPPGATAQGAPRPDWSPPGRVRPCHG